MLLNVSRPVVGAVLSTIVRGVGTSIAALVLKPWFVCGNDVIELSFGLQKLKVTSSGLSGEEDVCSDIVKLLLNGSDVPCTTGKLALGLGAAAAAAIGVAMLLGAFIAATRRLGGMWGATLVANLLGGALAIASGAIYVGLMVKETDGSSECKPAQAAPIIMVAGGVLSVFASCLYCTCCCRPASSTSRVEQVPMQQWQATPQY